MCDKPKRPMSAYMIWLNSSREQIKADYPGMKVVEIAKKGGEIWRSMTDKSEWEEKAAQAKEKYMKDLALYNAKEFCPVHYDVAVKYESEDEESHLNDNQYSRPSHSEAPKTAFGKQNYSMDYEYAPETYKTAMTTATNSLQQLSNIQGSFSNFRCRPLCEIVNRDIDKTKSGSTEKSKSLTNKETHFFSQENKETEADYHFGRMLHYLMGLPDGKEKITKYVHILNGVIKEN